MGRNKRPTLLLGGKVDLLQLMKGHKLVLGAASQARLLSLVSSPLSRYGGQWHFSTD
jgi:hypothetical protein